jgi:hypothetical protein
VAEARIWRSRRLLERAFILGVGVGMAWAAWGFWHDRQFPDRFTRLHLGMDRNSVEAILGAPDWEGTCTGYGGYLPRADCARELGYSSAFAPLRPVYYMVQLDRSGKVVEAEPIRSR